MRYYPLLIVLLCGCHVAPVVKGLDPVFLGGPGWQNMQTPGSADLRGVWGSSPTDVWAVGHDHEKGLAVVLHYDGTTWTDLGVDSPGVLQAVWGFKDGPLFVAGYQDKNVTLLRRDPGSTKWVPELSMDEWAFIFGLWGKSLDDMVAVGYRKYQGWAIWERRNGKWIPAKMPKKFHSELRGISGRPDGFAVAVGTRGTLLFREDGQWKLQEPESNHTLQGIWLSEDPESRPQAVMVGEGGILMDRAVWRSFWQEKLPPLGPLFHAVDSSGDRFIAVGEKGAIYHRKDSGSWMPVYTPTNAMLQGVQVFDTGEAFAVGTGGTILCLNHESPAVLKTIETERPSLAQKDGRVELNLFHDRAVPSTGRTESIQRIEFPEGEWGKATLRVSMTAMNDTWDRLFSILIEGDDRGWIEIERAATDYGYSFTYESDVSDFIPLFNGLRNVSLNISTPFAASWRSNVSLLLEPGRIGEPLRYFPIYTRFKTEPNSQQRGSTVTIKKPGKKGWVHLLTTGHSPSGSGPEEFGPARDVIVFVDETEVGRVRPWRTDCKEMGGHGTFYDRSGWCPRDRVHPFRIDIPQNLLNGKHTYWVRIPEAGNYWLVSATLIVQ